MPPITNNDPLLGQEVQVSTVDSGGFLVRQMPGGFAAANTAQMIDTYCASMDAVSDLLTQIFSPPPAP